MSHSLAPTCIESQAFKVLAQAMANFPTNDSNSHPLFPGIQEQYHREKGGEMFSTMVTVADRLIDEVLDGVTQDNSTPLTRALARTAEATAGASGSHEQAESRGSLSQREFSSPCDRFRPIHQRP